MRCPSCDFRDSIIYDSRPIRDAMAGVWRRRQCLDCEYRWTTYERNSADIPGVVTFDRSVNSLSQLVDAIEKGIDVDDLQAYPAVMTALRAAKKALKRLNGLDG